MFLWVKIRKIELFRENNPKGTHPPPKHFWVHWAKIHTSQGELWMRSRNEQIFTKKWKSMRGYKFTHIPTPPPVCGGHRTLHVGSDGGRNQTRQISAESIQGFLNPMGPKMTLLHWLGASPFTLYALGLTCYQTKRTIPYQTYQTC